MTITRIPVGQLDALLFHRRPLPDGLRPALLRLARHGVALLGATDHLAPPGEDPPAAAVVLGCVHTSRGRAIVLAEAAGARPGAARAALSQAELRVADLAAAGLTDAQIADRLGLSVRTISNQLRAAYRALGLRGRVELAARLLADPLAVGDASEPR